MRAEDRREAERVEEGLRHLQKSQWHPIEPGRTRDAM
jgi:hypothetical protein